MKKRLLSIFLILVMLLTSCSAIQELTVKPTPAPTAEPTPTPTPTPTPVPVQTLVEIVSTPVPTPTVTPQPTPTITPEPTPTPVPTPTPAPDGLFVTDLKITQGVVVSFEVREHNAKMAGYYFGSIPNPPKVNNHDWLKEEGTYIKICKWPGQYWLWLRDTEGHIYGPTAVEMDEDYYYHYICREGTEFPTSAISSYLPEHCNYSVDELNELIANAVAEAGIYSREAVVVAVFTQLSKLQSFGIRIPFFFFGYWSMREYGWYLNPDWGTVYTETEMWQFNTRKKTTTVEPGTHCNGFVHYAFRLAGLNLRNDGKTGETGDIAGIGKKSKNRVGTYEGRGGDILQSCTHHEMLIIDRYDDDLDGVSDGYIVAESNDTEGGQVFCKKPFEGYSSLCKVFNMDGAFYNTGTQKNMLKFWKNYHIPDSAWPEFLKKAVAEKTQYEIVLIDDWGVRTLHAGFRETLDDIPQPRGTDGFGSASAHWDIDLKDVNVEQNYVLNAVYE